MKLQAPLIVSQVSRLLAALLAVAPGIAQAQDEAAPVPKPNLISTSLTGVELAFLKQAGRQMLLEQKMTEIALKNAESEKIKEFASSVLTRQVVDAHRLASLSKKKGVPIPDELDEAQQKQVDTFREKTGLKFDKAYLDQIIVSRQEFIAQFESLTLSEDPEIRAFADRFLAGFREHLRFARRLTGTGGRGNSIPTFRTSVGGP